MIDLQLAVDLLLERDRRDLWSMGTQREALRFLRKAGGRLSTEQLAQLVDAILEGPPRSQFPDTSEREWTKLRDREVWIRLAKLDASGAALPKAATDELERLRDRYPTLQLDDTDYADEFPLYMTTGWIALDGGSKPDDFRAMSSDSFCDWALRVGPHDRDKQENWKRFCQSYPEKAVAKLEACSETDLWPTYIWQSTLWALRDTETPPDRPLRGLADQLMRMPEASLRAISIEASLFLATLRPIAESIYWHLWDRLWRSSLDREGMSERDLTAAINHPGGILAEQLLYALADQRPKPRSGLPSALEPRFMRIIEAAAVGAFFGRVILMSRLSYLFQVDPAWTERNLIPRLDWEHSEETPTLWEGFMWSPHVDPQLAAALKPHLLKVVLHQDGLPGRVGHNVARLFTILSVPPSRGIPEEDARRTIAKMKPNFLPPVPDTLAEMLSDTGEKAPTFWREVMGLWWNRVWPRTNEARTPAASESLAEMAVAAGDAFPEVVEAIKQRLTVVEWPGPLLRNIIKERLHERFPGATLALLDRIIAGYRPGTTRYLAEIIKAAEHTEAADSDERKRLAGLI